MTSNNSDHYALKMDATDDDWIQIELVILAGENEDEHIAQSLKLFQNIYYLKVYIVLPEKVNVKIMKAGNKLPVYLRQYIPNRENKLIIDITGWYDGYYDIIFTNSLRDIIAIGKIYIH